MERFDLSVGAIMAALLAFVLFSSDQTVPSSTPPERKVTLTRKGRLALFPPVTLEPLGGRKPLDVLMVPGFETAREPSSDAADRRS